MCVRCGLLSGSFRLLLDEVYITDPELATFSGLHVYLWIIKGDFVL